MRNLATCCWIGRGMFMRKQKNVGTRSSHFTYIMGRRFAKWNHFWHIFKSGHVISCAKFVLIVSGVLELQVLGQTWRFPWVSVAALNTMAINIFRYLPPFVSAEYQYIIARAAICCDTYFCVSFATRIAAQVEMGLYSASEDGTCTAAQSAPSYGSSCGSVVTFWRGKRGGLQMTAMALHPAAVDAKPRIRRSLTTERCSSRHQSVCYDSPFANV